MELSFSTRYIDGKPATTVRVKSDKVQDLKGHARIETMNGRILVTDSFDVIEKRSEKKDAEGNVYELYRIENHVQQEERFTPEKQEEVDKSMEKQRADIDFIAMVSDIDLEEA